MNRAYRNYCRHMGTVTTFCHVATRPEQTIGAAPMNGIGVMADGMAYPY